VCEAGEVAVALGTRGVACGGEVDEGRVEGAERVVREAAVETRVGGQ
jgi:hypothetical protein